MSHNPYPSSPITDAASVILYSPRTSTDDLICPLSPTSSLKGIYVRSRPTSMEVPAESPGFDFGGFYQAAFIRTIEQGCQSTEHALPAHSSCSTLSDENDPIFTPTSSESSHASSAATSTYTDEEYRQKNAARRTAETRARVRALNECHARARKQYAESITPSVKTTMSKNTVITLGLRRHFNQKGDHGTTCKNIEGDDSGVGASEMMNDQPQVQKKRSLYRSVSKKVYGVFHRKAQSTPQSIQVDSPFSDNFVNNTTTAPAQEPKPTEPVISSSISLFTRIRRPAFDSQQEPPRNKNFFSQRALSIRGNKITFPAAPNTVSLTSTTFAIQNNARLRHSLSFAGFADLPELDDGLHEATAEATQVANKASTMVRWANLQACDSDAVDDGYIFERNVE